MVINLKWQSASAPHRHKSLWLYLIALRQYGIGPGNGLYR